MKKFTKISLLCILSLCFVASFSFAQGAEDMATEAEMYFASGIVTEVSEAQIVISEYDFDAGQEVKVAYQVNAQTQLEGVAAIVDIRPGDDVEIEYQLTGDQKIATRIEKYAPETGEEEMEPATQEMEPVTE